MVGKTIVNVDIQEEYENGIWFDIEEWAEFLNDNSDTNKIVFLFNGPELGFPSESEYKVWLYDHGVSEETINTSYFFDKGYGFFRSCMDSGESGDSLIDFVAYMYENEITDSRDVDDEMWDDFEETTEHDIELIKDIIKHNENVIYIPELMEYMENMNSIYLTGGGVNECLKEVEIALNALKKPYEVIEEYTY